jgi:hypothetical protein
MAVKGSVPSEKMPMPMNMNDRKRPRIIEEKIRAEIISREDNPSSSLRVNNQLINLYQGHRWAPYAGPKVAEQTNYFRLFQLPELQPDDLSDLAL